MYHFSAWFFATLLVFFIQQWVAAIMMGLPVYYMCQLRPQFKHVAIFIVDLGILASIGAVLGLLAGGMSKDFKAARQAVIPTVTPQMLFAGFLISRDDLPVWCRWVYYVDLFQYALSLVRINEYAGAEFTDCNEARAAAGACFMTGNDYLHSQHLNEGQLPTDFALLGALLFGLSCLTFVVMFRVATAPSN